MPETYAWRDKNDPTVIHYGAREDGTFVVWGSTTIQRLIDDSDGTAGAERAIEKLDNALRPDGTPVPIRVNVTLEVAT